MAEYNGTSLKGFDNPAATEDDGSKLRPDLVISVQPRQGDSTRAELPVSTIDWHSSPRGQFIPVHGLDFLIGVSSLQIQQTVELDDLLSKIDSENRYIVRVPNGESLYLASETSSQSQRCLCGSGRAFVMHLHDNTRQEALQMQRRLAAASCCFPCRLQEMKVITPPGDYIGRVQQQCTWMAPFYLVRDAHDQVLFTIEGPAVMKRSALLLSEFKIMTSDSLREVGKIAHGWDRDLVSFTTTLTVPNTAVQPRHKALLLAASFLMSIEWHSGQFMRNAMHGHGDYRWRYRGRRGLFASYEGNFYVNSIHGYGAMSYPDGKVFTGLFNKDVRYGPGIESFACRRENVGLWRGIQLVRIPWRPAVPSLIPDLYNGIGGKLLVDPHRIVLRTTYQTIGKNNNALELLKECGSPPLMALKNWPKLYPKHCTDTASRLCNVDMFDHSYYNGKIYSLKQEGTIPENYEDLEPESQDDFEHIGPYYAWNNNEVTIDMMKHSFKHEWQREHAGVRKIDFVSVLSGPRKNFLSPAMHELDSRTLLMAAYLGHIASTAYLVNERGVEPNISDVQGNTAVMYATCGNQTDILHFLVEAGAEVDSFNDSCCTALGIALVHLACVQADIPPGGTVQAMVPPPPTGPPPQSQDIFEWNINRDGTPLQSTLQYSASKDKKSIVMPKENPEPKKKTNEEFGYDSDVSLSDENKLYTDINAEYVFTVNELFSVPSGQTQYLFTTRDMVQDVLSDEPQNVTMKPGAKNPKVLNEVMKPSKETVWQHADGDDKEASLTTYDIKKIEMLDNIKSTILKLLELGANPSLVRCPQPGLLIAVVSSCLDLVSQLVRHGANVNEINPNIFNYSMLDVAVSLPLSHDNYQVIAALLAGGARADRRLPGVLVPPAPPAPLTDPPHEIPGPTLLHAIMARKPENEEEHNIRKLVVEILLDYKCDPLIQFKGRSAFEVATKSMELLNIVMKSPNTDLNGVINDHNQTILVKMFSMPFFRMIDANERLQTLTNLLLFGADPHMKCKNGDSVYRNIFEFAKETQAELDNTGPSRAAAASPATNPKSLSKQGEKSKSGQQPKLVVDDPGNYRQATDLVRECARVLHIRWLQAKLTKELVEIIYKYRHRLWPMILKEHKSKQAAGLWLEPQRCLEIWDLLKTTKKKMYKDKRTLKHLLCIVQFYHMRSSTSYRLDPVTSTERDMVDDTIACMLKEHREAIYFDQLMMPLKRRYVQPELFVKEDSKFDVCFECALPFEEEKIECKSCKLVSFCSMVCMKDNVQRANCHPCSETLQAEYFSTPSISDNV